MPRLTASWRGKSLTLLIVVMMAFPGMTMAQGVNVTDRPGGMEMTADLVLARPALLISTVLGTGIFLVSLPFSALGGNTAEAAETLVMTPLRATFMRCLGCSKKHEN
jgi:hypothetical protein